MTDSVQGLYLPPFYVFIREYTSYFKLDFSYTTLNDYTDVLEKIKEHSYEAYLMLKTIRDSENKIDLLPMSKGIKKLTPEQIQWRYDLDLAVYEHKEKVINCIEFFKTKNIPTDKLIN